MDDISEYRRRHREAYLKRVASSGPKEAASDDGCAGSTSFRKAEAEPSHEGDLYEGQLSDKTKRDRYRSPRLDEDYESSLELAKRLQKEFDEMDGVRRPDDSYKECLLSSASSGDAVQEENPDVDLQKAIAKSLIDM